MGKEIKTADHTWLILRKKPNFQKFFKGYIKLLQKKFKQVEVKGNNYSYSYYSCGQPHDPRNPDWKPFKFLWWYCEKTGYDFYVVKDLIEEQLGRPLECECQVLNDERELRRRDLERMFGVDFGTREVDIV